MSLQRRRGETAIVYKSIPVTNARGDVQDEPDMTSGQEVVGAFYPDRSSRAEVVGQLSINMINMCVSADVETDNWGLVYARGKYWDLAGPPVFRHGTRNTRHKTLSLRERPPLA